MSSLAQLLREKEKEKKVEAEAEVAVEVEVGVEGHVAVPPEETTITPVVKKEEKKEEEAEAFIAHPKIRYKNLKGRKIIRADGSVMKPVKDELWPITIEEHALCDYFCNKGFLVKL